jgi:2-polyprenyl-6-methoxyphenol hydroxylase-like FAD-dependent oxidoreductase
MALPHRTEVLIVGAGPVGLLAGVRLAEAGVKVRIIDRHQRTGLHSYGLALHARSLERLEQLGATRTLTQHGRPIGRVVFHPAGGSPAELSLDLGRGKHPGVLVLPQSRLEVELEDALGKHGVRVQWNQRLESLALEGDSLTTEIAHLDRVTTGYPIARSEWTVTKVSKLVVDYVIGADGYHSRVRETLGIDYVRHAPPATYAVYEVEGDGDAGDALHVMLDGDLVAALWPMHGQRRRYSFPLESVQEYEPTLDGLNRLLRERAPTLSAARGDLIWTSLVDFDRRLASALGRDRVWLAGDAAHLTIPVGVQSMNAGLIDADELALVLIDVLKGARKREALADYERERMGELRATFGDPKAWTPPEGLAAWARDAWPAVVGSIPATGKDLTSLVDRFARSGSRA